MINLKKRPQNVQLLQNASNYFTTKISLTVRTSGALGFASYPFQCNTSVLNSIPAIKFPNPIIFLRSPCLAFFVSLPLSFSRGGDRIILNGTTVTLYVNNWLAGRVTGWLQIGAWLVATGKKGKQTNERQYTGKKRNKGKRERKEGRKKERRGKKEWGGEKDGIKAGERGEERRERKTGKRRQGKKNKERMKEQSRKDRGKE